jgi:hypothetical protein
MQNLLHKNRNDNVMNDQVRTFPSSRIEELETEEVTTACWSRP